MLAVSLSTADSDSDLVLAGIVVNISLGLLLIQVMSNLFLRESHTSSLICRPSTIHRDSDCHCVRPSNSGLDSFV